MVAPAAADRPFARLLDALEGHVGVAGAEVAAAGGGGRRQVLQLEVEHAATVARGARRGPVAGAIRLQAVGGGRAAWTLAERPAHVVCNTRTARVISLCYSC